jgi:hydrogenase-4 component F
MSLVVALVGVPVAAALACALWQRWAAVIGAVSAIVTALVSIAVFTAAVSSPAWIELDGLVRVDALSGLIVLVIGLVGAIAALYAISYLPNEVRAGHLGPGQVRWFHVWSHLSLAAMLAVPVIDDLGLMWVAVEATTLTTALLVGSFARGNSLEAAWKYLILCGVGIAIALFGILLTYYAAVQALGEGATALSWSELQANARALDPDFVRLAFVLVLVGFGTKAGLAPMHTWLPDAHGEAPTPVSVLLSGALLSCALYAVIRFHVLATAALGSSFSADLLVAVGAFSIAIAVPFVLVQHDLKRLLAYSSVEHIGIVTLAVGIGGPLALFAAAFHLLNHALAKSALFVAAGALGQRYGTHRLARMRGAFEVAPLPALGLLVGALAITGVPPFATFASELGIVRAGLAGRPAAFAGTAVLLVATLLVFGGMLFHILRVVMRRPPRESRTAAFPLALPLIGVPLFVLLALGIWLPPGLRDAFAAVAAVLEPRP